MKTLTDKVVVITGAGSGIGRALAVEAAGQGARLALSDERVIPAQGRVPIADHVVASGDLATSPPHTRRTRHTGSTGCIGATGARNLG